MIDLEDILSKLPIFSSLNKKALKQLTEIASPKDFKKNQIIYRENDPPNNLYIVISGRIKTYTKSSSKEDRILEYLYRGTCFGIISLLTEQPHSVTAQAANDALVAQISKNKFTTFLNNHPLLAIEFSRILSRRVKKRVDRDKNIFESQIISVYSSNRIIGKTSYSLVLAKALQEEARKKIIVIEVRDKKAGYSVPSQNKILEVKNFSESTLQSFLEKVWNFDYLRIYYKTGLEYDSKTIPLLLSFLTQIYNFIILDLPSLRDPLITTSLCQSDSIHFISQQEPKHPKKLRAEIDYLKNTYKIKENIIKVIQRAPLPRQTYEHKNILATLPSFKDIDVPKIIKSYPSTTYAKVVRKIARNLASVRIGLALGSGAAFGLAHIGVLKVLEEHNLDIDIVSGSSLGSVIAALWGLGNNWRQIRKLVYKFEGFPVFSFFDIGLSTKSFLKGGKLKKTLKELFGNYTLGDLKRPVLIIAFDFLKRESRVFYGGKLLIRDAVLASCSMPGVFAPLKKQKDLFLDGGILNPLPVGNLVREGIKKIISVNVTPSKEEIQKEYQKSINKKRLNVFDFIFGSIEAMQREFIQDAISLSDIVIHPRFQNVMWTDFKRIDYFIRQGEKAALMHIDKIKQLQEI